MSSALDPTFAGGLRSTLVALAASERGATRRRRHRTWTVWGLTAALAVGATAAAGTIMSLPGGQVTTVVGIDEVSFGAGDGVIELRQAPRGATAVAFELELLSAGTVYIGSGGMAVTVPADEVGTAGAVASGQLGLDQVTDGVLAITTGSPDTRWRITAAYVANDPVPLATNASGETYGTIAYGADPDLIAAYATNGEFGYVRREDLAEASEGQPPLPQTPTDGGSAAPARSVIPVYDSDGDTVVGEFEVQVAP